MLGMTSLLIQELRKRGAGALLAFGAFMLALEPMIWLVNTWLAPESLGFGVVAFLLTLAMCGLSFWSGPAEFNQPIRFSLYWVLAFTALLRLVSQILDINVVGALLLSLDVYVLARLLKLDCRPFRVSPVWLAFLFCFSLPVEPIMQRLVGYPLQYVAAFVASGMLQIFLSDVAVQGIRILINGVDVLVDLPCSGSELLSVLAVFFALGHTVCRVSPAGVLLSAPLFCVIAVLVNGARVATLALGIGYAEYLSFNIMQPLPHAFVGTGFASLGAILLSLMFRGLSTTDSDHVPCRASHAPVVATPIKLVRVPMPAAFVFAGFALAVGAISPQPVDASPSLDLPQVPTGAAGFLASSNPLTQKEREYFEIYGGAATRASYGPFGLLVVTTQSPLRHLHDPAVCFTGMGYAVEFLGTDFHGEQSVYVVTDPDSLKRYQLLVRYLGPDGVALSIAEVVWRWAWATVGGTDHRWSQWTMVQQIVPERLLNSPAAEQFRSAINRIYDY